MFQPFFLSTVVGFSYLYSYYPATTRGLDEFSGAYPNKLMASMVHSGWSSSI